MEPESNRSIGSYLRGVEIQLKLLRICLKEIKEGKDRTLRRIRQTILKYKNLEVKETLKINDFQLNLLFSLQDMMKIGSMQWPVDFEYKEFYWKGYRDCGRDVSNILGLERRKILREVELLKAKKKKKRRKSHVKSD
jgi:hypothetical protein